MRSTTSLRRVLGLLTVLMIVAAACGEGDPSSAGTSPTTPATQAATSAATSAATEPTTHVAPTTTAAPPTTHVAPTTAAEPPTTQPAPAPPTTAEPTPTAAPPPTTTTLHGVEIDFGPTAGDVLAVFGVTHDDVLNVRAGPGTDQTIVARLDPLADDVVALGTTRQLTRSFWYQVEVDGTVGWVRAGYVAYIGDTHDVTSRVVELLGEIPHAGSMTDLGLAVAESLACDDPASRLTISVAPTVGDLGEITYDVVGLGDDSLRGFRLHVFGSPDVDGFSLKSVESTVLCARGVTDGICA